LASFYVWTKSLKCKDAVNRDSTFRVMSVVFACKSKEFQVPCQPSGLSSHPVQTLICPLFHPSGRRVIPSGRQTDQYHSSGPHTISRSLCTSLHPSGRFSSTSGCLPVLDQFLISFQVSRKGRSINRPDARLRKARITIQI
jgi:hypothetical protein